jgi:uncharacterized protein (DUF983 family)
MKRSLLTSILGMHCPRCRTGKMFSTGSFSFKRSFDMNSHCPHCQQNLTPEPGFYFGAMFLSYIITGWFSLIIVGIVHWVFKVSLLPSFAILLAILALLFVWFYRISRVLWIHLNVKYQPGGR